MEEQIVEKKKKGEKTAETITPKPEPSPPSKLKPLVNVVEETYNYLKKHGASTPLRIAGHLNMDPLEVMKALKELEKQGKIQLRP